MKNIMEMGMCKINEHMGKTNPRCWYKNTTPKKWLFELLN
jgi:hypothetical protein